MVSQHLGRGAQSSGAPVLRAAYQGALEGLGGKAGSEGLLCSPLQPGKSSFTPSPLPTLFHPHSLPSPCPPLPADLLSSSVVPKGPPGRAERQEQGAGLGDTAGM